jgi:hypothetical protein
MRMSHAAALSSGLLVWCSAWAAPSIVLEPATFDWGRQTENKGEYTYTFTVKNAGDEELQITRVRPGCSCTKVELKKQNLAPGESTEMTGGLTTKGNEGAIQKGIILTTNDPLRQTAVANLAIRFPINGQGLRLKGSPIAARLRQDALWAYVVIENCEPSTEVRIEGMELPAGWDSPQTLPIIVRPEDRMTVTLTRKTVDGVEPEAFDSLPFTLVTDSAKTPRVQGALAYSPETRITTVSAPAGQQAAGTGAAPVRWPMAKPAPLVAPIMAPPVTPQTSAPVVAPTAEPRAAGAGAAVVPAAVPAAAVVVPAVPAAAAAAVAPGTAAAK